MSTWFWESIRDDAMQVPSHRDLGELTSELGEMLGSPDPEVREELAYPILAAWIENGVYDHLLHRLGNGLCERLTVGIDAVNDDAVFVRSYAALVLADIIERDNRRDLLDDRTVLGWGDRIAAWLVAEKDLRGFVPGKGWAHAVAHGADAIGALAGSGRLKAPGLILLLDVIADRVLEPTPEFFVSGEPDRLAAAALVALRRDLVELEDLDPWLNRLGGRAMPQPGDRLHPYRVNGNVQAFLRALYVHLALAPERPEVRPDLLLALVERLRASNPEYLRPRGSDWIELATT